MLWLARHQIRAWDAGNNRRKKTHRHKEKMFRYSTHELKQTHFKKGKTHICTVSEALQIKLLKALNLNETQTNKNKPLAKQLLVSGLQQSEAFG